MNWVAFTIEFIVMTLMLFTAIESYRRFKRVNADHLSTLKTLEIYKERNAQLEKFESELKDAQLKMKVMKMLINDDEAIDELLSAIKDKPLVGAQHEYFRSQLHNQNQLAAAQGLGRGSLGRLMESADGGWL